MSLLALPNELLQAILERTPSDRDINSLIRCNHHLYQNFNTFLYRHNVTKHAGWAMKWAARRGREDTMQKFLDAGGDATTNDCNKSLLFLAVAHRHTGILKMLLKNGASTKSVNEEDESPLFVATGKGYTEIVELLLENGAEVNSRNSFKERSPLEWAAFHRGSALVVLLIEHDADVNSRNWYGRTPLMEAAIGGDELVVKILLDSGADINAGDDSGHTALMWAVTSREDNIARLLLAHGADPEIKDGGNRTALSWAVFTSRKKVMRLLLDAGVDPNCYNSSSQSSLLYAVETNNVLTMELLLEYGANPNIHSELNRTLLFLAVLQANEDMVRVLLKHDSTGVQLETSAYRSPLSLARDFGLYNIYQLLAEHCDGDLGSGLDPSVEPTAKTDDESWVNCDGCGIDIPNYDIHFHCDICDNDNFDLCLECFRFGVPCEDNTHDLDKLKLKDETWVRAY